MNIIQLLKQLPENLRRLGERFVRAFQNGDVDHPDELIELAAFLERSPEGQAFVEAFCQKAVGM